MKPGNFILDGQDSETFGAFIQDKPLIETPKRRVEQRTVFGRSGDVLFDEEAYDNTSMELILFVLGTKDHTASDNRDRVFDWFDSGDYMDFIPYFDPGKIYRIKTTSAPSFTSRYYFDEGQQVNTELTIKPFKYYVDSPKVTLTTPGAINNPYSKESLPLIKITGTGDITLTIGGLPFVIKNVTDHIWLDSQAMFAYKDVSGVLTNENGKIFTRNYPYLRKGITNISWTGNVTSLEIEPRWRTLA